VKPLTQPLLWISSSSFSLTFHLQSINTSLDFWVCPRSPFRPTTLAFPSPMRPLETSLGKPFSFPSLFSWATRILVPSTLQQDWFSLNHFFKLSQPTFSHLWKPHNLSLKPSGTCGENSSGMVMILEKSGLWLAGRKFAGQNLLKDLDSRTQAN